jgi:putative membrane protein
LNQAAVWTPYCGAAPVPSELLARWNFDPPLLAIIALAAWLGLRYADGAPGQRRLWIAATLLTMLLFASPFCALTSALFSARAVHHLALTALLAPRALPVGSPSGLRFMPRPSGCGICRNRMSWPCPMMRFTG